MAEAKKAGDQTNDGIQELEGKYLTFRLSKEEYGLEILKVREIIGMMDITSVPQTPVFVKGVINLRGKVIPVLDLRLKFGMESKEYDERTCIIVVEVRGAVSSLQMGVVVDSVSEVTNIKSNQIEQAPSFGGRLDTNFILAMAKTEDGVKILLDIDKILNADEMVALSKAA